ncbi:hypothetical protein ACSW29_16645 [Rhodococcus sp. GB-02]
MLDVGELVARLTVDMSGYTRDVRSADQQFSNLARSTAQSSTQISQSLQGASRGLERMGQGAQDAGRHLGQVELNRNLDRAAQQAADRIQELQSNANRAGQSTREIELNAQLLRDARQSANQIEELRRNAQQAASSVNDIEVRNSLERDLRAAQGELERVRRSAEQASESTNSIGEGLQERMSGAFGGIGDLAGQSGESGGGNFLAGFASRIGGLSGKGGPIVMSLAGVAVLGLAAGAVLANAIADGMEQERVSDLIQAKLDVDDATMRRVGSAAGASYSNGWGESVSENMDGIRAAMQAGLLDKNADTKTIQGTIDQLNIVSSLLGEDLPAVARAAGKSLQSGIAKDGTGALDLLAQSAKANLNVSEDLLDSQVEYSTQLRALGLEGAEGWGLVSQAVNGGARDTDVAIDMLKEFKLRATDGTASAADGFDKLNVNAAEFKTAMNEGGTASRDMIATVLRNLNAIQDPTEKNAAALALFGTKFEDVQDAAFAMNLDTAVEAFGKVEGSARKAGDTMSSNTASSFDSAKRSIETSSADIKLALAQAFGPALTDMATWVSEHKPEIIGFFTQLADAGFATLDAMLAFTSGALRGWAVFADGVGGMMGSIINVMALGVENAARFADIIPGMGDKADTLRDLADDMRGFANTVGTAGDKARDMADGIDSARPVIEGMRNDVRDAGEEAENSARLMQALGTAVVEDIPDSKTITISDNSPETVQRLQDLGFKVETTPNGIRVTATTDEADTIIGDFINRERVINVAMVISERRTAAGVPSDFIGPTAVDNGYYVGRGPSRGGGGNFADGAVRTYADGGIDKLPDQAVIQKGQGKGLVNWAEGETEWESFIPGARSKRRRSEAILSETARRFGFGLVKFDALKMADGGVIDKDGLDASMSWARSVDPATYQMGGFSPKALDCSGAVSGAVNTALGLGPYDSRMSTVTAAEWLQAKGAVLGRGGPGTMRVGWWDKGGGANGHMAMTYPDGTNFESNGSEGVVINGKTGADDPSFTDHAYFPTIGDLGQNYGLPPDTRTEKEKIADTIISEGKKRGMSDKQIKAAVMASLEETRLENLDYGMDGDNKGILQQRDSWGTAEERMDPSKAAGMFYDELAKLDSANMTEAQMAQAVQRSGTADGSNYADEAAEAEQIIAASNARGNGQMTVGTTESGVALATDGQRVFVTNWPGSSSLTSTPSAPTTTSAPAAAAAPDDNVIWKGAFRVFENGGIRGLPEQAGIYPDGADLVRFAERGTGGEGYIPLSPAKRPQSLAVTKKIVNGFGFDLVPFEDGGIHGGLGGFGGYVGEAPGLKVPTTANGRRAAAYNALAFGVGGAFALASGFDADGHFTGKFDTGANSSAQLEKQFSEATDEIKPILEGILLAIKNREPIRATVNVGTDDRMANIAIMKGGL